MKSPLDVWSGRLRILKKRGLDAHFVKLFETAGPGKWEGVVKELLLLSLLEIQALNQLFYKKREEHNVFKDKE